MKLVGVILLVCGTTGTGWVLRERLKERICSIGQAIWLMRFMESEIGYQKSTLSVVFAKAAGRMTGCLGKVTKETAKRLRERGGEDFCKIWQEAWKKHSQGSGFDKKEIAIIRELATDGYQDVHMQLVQIKMVRKQLEEIKRQLEAELVQKSRVYLCVGMLSGMVVSIILI